MVEKTKTQTVKTKAPAKKPPQKTKARQGKHGRPPLLTQERYDAIIGAIKLGSFSSVAAGANGISRTTFYNWMDRGRTEIERMRMTKEKEPKSTEVIYVTFLNDVETAREYGTNQATLRVINAGQRGDWRADAWYLEKTRPELFGKKEEVVMSGSIDSKMVVDMGDLEAKIAMVLANRKNEGGQ